MAKKEEERYVKVKVKNNAGRTVTKWKDTKTGKIHNAIPLGANLKAKGGELGISELPKDIQKASAEKQKKYLESFEGMGVGGEGLGADRLSAHEDLLDQAIVRENIYRGQPTEEQDRMREGNWDLEDHRTIEDDIADASRDITIKDYYSAALDDTSQVYNFQKAEALHAYQTTLTSIGNAQHAQGKVDEATNHTYTTSFREAIKNSGMKQAWEDTIDGDAPLEKSNVFSKAEMDWGMYKEGDTLGVMTRRQRRAYDEAVSKARAQAAMDKNPEYSDPSDFQGGDGVLKPETKPKEMAPNTAEVKVDEQKPDLTIQQMFGVTPQPEAPIEYDENLLNKLGSMFSPRSR